MQWKWKLHCIVRCRSVSRVLFLLNKSMCVASLKDVNELLRGYLNCKNRWGSAFWWNRGGGALKFRKKPNFIITIRDEIPTFSSVGPFFEEGGRGSRKFRPIAEILGIFSIEEQRKSNYIQFSIFIQPVSSPTKYE